MSVYERVRVSVDAFPVLSVTVEDLCDPQIPTMRLALSSEDDCRALDHDQPRGIAIDAAVDQLDLARSRRPLSSDGELPLEGSVAAEARASNGTHDRALVGQRVEGSVSIDPGCVVSAAAGENSGELSVPVRHAHILVRTERSNRTSSDPPSTPKPNNQARRERLRPDDRVV